MKCRLCGSEARTALPYRYLWRDAEFRLSRCRGCTLIAVDPEPDSEQIASFYDQEYFETGLHGLTDSGHTYADRMTSKADLTRRFIAEHLLPHHPTASSFFEVGAATGHLLAGARELGIGKVSGIEISSHAADIAKESFDIELHVGDVAAYPAEAQAGQWDIVYAGDVLEHVPDPRGLLDLMARLLSPSGVAIVRIPTTFDLLSSRMAPLFLNATGKILTLPDAPYHLHEFTRETAKALFETRFSDLRFVSGIVPASDLNTKGGRLLYRLKKAVHYLNIPLTKATGRFGDRLMVVARRPRS